MCHLEHFLEEQIAAMDGVSVSEVTLEYIRRRRKELYADPRHRWELASEYGGWNYIGLEVHNHTELENQAKRALSFLSQFCSEDSTGGLLPSLGKSCLTERA